MEETLSSTIEMPTQYLSRNSILKLSQTCSELRKKAILYETNATYKARVENCLRLFLPVSEEHNWKITYHIIYRSPRSVAEKNRILYPLLYLTRQALDREIAEYLDILLDENKIRASIDHVVSRDYLVFFRIKSLSISIVGTQDSSDRIIYLDDILSVSSILPTIFRYNSLKILKRLKEQGRLKDTPTPILEGALPLIDRHFNHKFFEFVVDKSSISISAELWSRAGNEFLRYQTGNDDGYSIFKALLERKLIDPYSSYCCPMDRIIERNCPRILELFLEYTSGPEYAEKRTSYKFDFCYHCQNDNIDMFKLVVESGRPLQYSIREAFNISVKYGSYRIVKYLINNGMYPTYNDFKCSALGNHTKIFLLLMKADKNKKVLEVVEEVKIIAKKNDNYVILDALNNLQQ